MTAPPRLDAPVPAFPWGAVATLALVGFVTATDVSLTTVLLEPMKRELAFSDVQIGLIQGTAFGLAFGIGAFPMGRLIDRANRSRLLLAALMLWMAALAFSSKSITC